MGQPGNSVQYQMVQRIPGRTAFILRGICITQIIGTDDSSRYPGVNRPWRNSPELYYWPFSWAHGAAASKHCASTQGQLLALAGKDNYALIFLLEAAL